MERKWLARPYQEGDEEGILELRQAVYPEKEYDWDKWLRWWRWMYKGNPAGAGLIWLAEHNGKIVGQYPLIFMNMKVRCEVVRASQNVDVMTHPDYQHQGIFYTLARAALKNVGKEGVHITIGFPNEAAYPGHIKSGWFDICSMQILLKPLNWGNVLRLKTMNKFLLKLGTVGGGFAEHTVYRTKEAPIIRGLTITQTSSFDDRINEFWTRVSNQHPIMVVRNKDCLNWRYSTPGVNYSILAAEKAGEIVGYLILRQGEEREVKVGRIFDMMAESAEVMHCLISKAIEQCIQNKTDLIFYHLIANKSYHQVLKWNGFISSPFIKGGRFCAYSSSPYIPMEFLKNPENWFVQIGDSDAG